MVELPEEAYDALDFDLPSFDEDPEKDCLVLVARNVKLGDLDASDTEFLSIYEAHVRKVGRTDLLT